MRITEPELAQSIALALHEWDPGTGAGVVAAFVYGSVAAGTAGPHSDLDLFVITTEEPSSQALAALRASAIDLQIGLGYSPDLDYPVELFAADACASLLAGPDLTTAFTAAARGPVPPSVVDSDVLEVARALTGPALDVITDPATEHLRQQARLSLTRAQASVPVSLCARAATRLRLPP